MTEILNGNCLVAQSGGPTSVINSSLAGVITEALNHECIEEIYGGLNGVKGILQEQLVDLASETQQNIRGLRVSHEYFAVSQMLDRQVAPAKFL